MSVANEDVLNIHVVVAIKGGGVIFSTDAQEASPSATFCAGRCGIYRIRDPDGRMVGFSAHPDGTEVDT